MARKTTAKSTHLQLPLWAPKSEWRPPSMEELPSWKGARRIAIDCETRDPYLKELGIGVRRGGYVVGVSFAIEDGPSHYLPFRHSGGDNLDAKQVVAYLKAQAGEFDGDYVGANLSYDLDYLLEEGLQFHPESKFRDMQIADPLIYELHDSFSLDNIAKRHGLPGKDEGVLRRAALEYGIDPKSGMWQLPARYVGEYATADVVQPLLTLRRQERLIDENDLWNIWNLETEVLPVLVRMRRRGVRVDFDRLQRVEEWTLAQEAAAVALVKRETGYDIGIGNIWKANALAAPLEHLGIQLAQTSTGQPSIDKELLASIDHPVAKAIAWARKTNKLRTTFAESVRKYQINGRIHCTFNQMARETEKGDQRGARYGRLSCTDPNLQQQPNPEKDPDLSGEWRKIYLPEEGALWSCNDYSQQEPRWTTHFAAVMDLPKAREAAQAYHDNPDLDNHQFMADLTGLPRPHAKNVYLGLCYGEGGAKLCRELGLPTRWALSTGPWRRRKIEYFESHVDALNAKSERGEGYVWETAGEEGQKILDTFDERAPFIRLVAEAAQEKAKQRGYVITIEGRHLHFPQRQDGSYDWAHKALNRVIQGSSADQTKRACVELDRAGIHLMLQVHDETDNSVADHDESRRVGQIMREVIPARVPFKVDNEVGPSWGEVEKLVA